MAGVAGVKVAPEYRGKGAGRALMTELTTLMAGRGYPLSALYAATMPIYRQQGWELAGARYTAKFPIRSLRGLDEPSTDIEIRRAGPADAAAVIDVLGRVHGLARDCGPITFAEPVVRDWLANQDSFCYLADDGFLRYQWHGGDQELYVDKLVAASARTTRALVSVLASHSSVASRVLAQVSPADQLWWLLREQDGDIAERYSWMLRILDAPAAIAARGFPPVDVEVPLLLRGETTSPRTPLVLRGETSPRTPLVLTDGLWQLSVSSAGKARLSRTTSPALPGTVIELGARGLAALYAGTPVATLRRAGLATGGTAESDALLDAAFAASSFMLDDF